MTRSRAVLVILLAAMAVNAGPAGAHPDLLEQIERLDQQLARESGNAELLVRRADLHRRHEDYAAALRDFAAARAVQPDNHAFDVQEGRLRLETGDPDRADALFSSHLEAHPGHAAAWYLRGQARVAMGQPAPAALDFARAIATSDAPTPVLYRQQASALVAAGEDHWQAARDALDSGLLRHPVEVSLLGLATDIALAQAELARARDYMARLPKGLEVLPQWRARFELAACGKAGGSETAGCASAARAQLAAQVAAWLRENGVRALFEQGSSRQNQRPVHEKGL
jgi:predicted Zn-dependent protease